MYKKIMIFSAIFASWLLDATDVASWLEVKPSYFLFSSAPMNEIYNHGGFEIQASGSVGMMKYLDFYGSVGYRQAWGNALNSGEDTSLIVVPFDIGLKPIFTLSERFHYFFAVGPRFFYFHQKNNSLYVQNVLYGGGVGAFVTTGFNVQLADSFLLGIFGEYSYETKTIYPTEVNVMSNGNVQLGGFAFGISLGYSF